MNDARNYHVIDAVPDRLDVSPRRSHRRWSQEAKARLIEASLAPGANVSAIAREAGIAPSQLFGWRRKALKGGTVNRSADEGRLGFVEIAAIAGQVEIEVGDGEDGESMEKRREEAEREAVAAETARLTRDYFRVEDTDGRRFWLYREGLYGPAARPRWFMQGLLA
jgi:transposase